MGAVPGYRRCRRKLNWHLDAERIIKMKAMLEVEMPEGCYDCQFCTGTECGVVEGMPTIDLFGEEGIRPKWCPLILLEAGTKESRNRK